MTVFPLYIPSRQVADKDLAQQQQLALLPSRAPMSACPIVNGSWRGEKLDWVLPPHHAVFQQYLGGQSHGRGLGLSSKRCFSADSVGFPGSLHLYNSLIIQMHRALLSRPQSGQCVDNTCGTTTSVDDEVKVSRTGKERGIHTGS